MNGKHIQLVVAHYQEELGWLERAFPYVDSVLIYHKDDSGRATSYLNEDGKQNHVYLDNVGREAHTYAWHMAFGKLKDVTVFCQGNPFEHCDNFIGMLMALRDGTLPIQQRVLMPGGDEVDVTGFKEWADIFAWDSLDGGMSFQHWTLNPDHIPLDIQKTWNELHDREMPALANALNFGTGAQFVVTSEAVEIVRAMRGERFFARAEIILSRNEWTQPHVFERLWARIFTTCLSDEDVEAGE